jgi:hypothetical protein
VDFPARIERAAPPAFDFRLADALGLLLSQLAGLARSLPMDHG